MNPNPIFGLSSVLCFSLPIWVIVFFRLYRHTSLIALLLYYSLAVVHCLAAESIPPVPSFTNSWDVAYSFVEIPLVLFSLLFFCHIRERRQMVQKVLIGFVVYEVMVSLYFRFSPGSSVYILVPGLAIVVGYTAFLFLRQARFTVLHQGKNIGRVLMLGAILFSYGSNAVVHYTCFIQKRPDTYAICCIYFVASTVASVLMSVGLYLMRHRIKDLQELKVTRRELQMVFGS